MLRISLAGKYLQTKRVYQSAMYPWQHLARPPG